MSAEEALKIIRYYELRWRIEEFHKAWKSAGTKVGSFRHQRLANIEKMMVISAFVSIRLLQLRELATSKRKTKHTSCEVMFSLLEWKLLWHKTEKDRLPDTAPSVHWAYYALAKLGKWHDSKRTGIVGWPALWLGWDTLMKMLEGIKLAKSIDANL